MESIQHQHKLNKQRSTTHVLDLDNTPVLGLSLTAVLDEWQVLAVKGDDIIRLDSTVLSQDGKLLAHAWTSNESTSDRTNASERSADAESRRGREWILALSNWLQSASGTTCWAERHHLRRGAGSLSRVSDLSCFE